MLSVPPLPEVPANQRDTCELTHRHEDLTQDGRMQLVAFFYGLGEIVWNRLMRAHPASPAMIEQGVLPILSRVAIEGYGGPFGVSRPFVASGGFQLGHATREDGSIERLLFNAWSDLRAPNSHALAPPPPLDAPHVHVGRVYAEFTFTRLFAPAAERKVTRLDLPGMPAVPPDRLRFTPPLSLLALPEGATALESGFALDSTPTVFGLCHTDVNQHVSSLVYMRLFEEAALRRFASLGESTALLARFLDIGYRKPCFAGESVRFVLRAFRLGERLGAVGAVVSEQEAGAPIGEARPRCCLRMMFER